jgi:hypothetical protein
MASSQQELFQLREKALEEGVTMAELGRRGGVKTQAKRRKVRQKEARKKQLEENFERAKAAGRIWWDD